jgi:beta-lactamase regulating signal transducer with metallopeptidase domain
MSAEWPLHVVASLAGFFLKTVLAFALCLALSRLIESAKLRFAAWSGFVLATVAYWFYLLIANWTYAQPPLENSSAASVHRVAAPVAAWRVPFSWAAPLSSAVYGLSLCYVLILSWLLFRHWRQHHHLKWVLQFASEAPEAVGQIFLTASKELGIRRSRLLLLPGMTSPATFGWLRPIILLPAAFAEGDRQGLEDVLRHELFHVRRRDALWNELAALSRCFVFFHPAVWYAVRRLRVDRELACDSAVVAAHSPQRRVAYAECLVRFARLNVVSEPAAWGVDFAASADQLAVRVESILGAAEARPGWLRGMRMVMGGAFCLLFVTVAPSLGVLLSFARAQVLPAPVPAAVVRSARMDSPGRRHRGAASKARQASAAGDATPVMEEQSPSGAEPVNDRPASASLEANSGPQLLRRGDPKAAANDGQPGQIIPLDGNDAAGEASKSGKSKQAIQETATAALGIYQRVSAIDRH